MSPPESTPSNDATSDEVAEAQLADDQLDEAAGGWWSNVSLTPQVIVGSAGMDPSVTDVPIDTGLTGISHTRRELG